MGIYGSYAHRLMEAQVITEKFNLSSKIKSLFNSNKNKKLNVSGDSYGKAAKLHKSSINFLGSPIYYDPVYANFDPVVSELKKDAESNFIDYMKNDKMDTKFFTKQNYGADINDPSKYKIQEAIIDIIQTGYLYTIIGTFEENNYPFSIRILFNISENNISAFPGNIRIKS